MSRSSDIVRPVCRMVEEAFHSPERPVRCRVDGDVGHLPAQVATPLAVILNELFQNAFDHAYPEEKELDGGQVVVRLRRTGDELVVGVSDDGAGLPDAFDLERSTGLGLSIVRTLVTSELGGPFGCGLATRRRTGRARRPNCTSRYEPTARRSSRASLDEWEC